MFIQRIIKEKSEELNSPFGNMAFCKIKFHKGVEFNFASEVRYTQDITPVFILQKMAFSAIILLGYCVTSFVVSSYQESFKDSLSVN